MNPEPKRTTNPANPADRLDMLACKPQAGMLSEMLEFLRMNKKWWLIPIILVLLLLGLLILLSSTALAPFIYTLF